jgi:lipoprotein-anchoring transpeptidase ErfK/SrfK
MSKMKFAVCVAAVVASGCASQPPAQIPPELASVAPKSQGQGVPTSAPAEGEAAERATDQQGQGFPLVAGTDEVGGDNYSDRVMYKELSSHPPAESRALRFHLGNQTFDYFEDGDLIRTGPISSGKAGKHTPMGKFAVLGKDKDKKSSLYKNEIGTQAWMPYSLRFHGNYFIHEGWLPGYAASHGCIRLGYYDARLLFERMKIGDPVTVSN